MFHARHVAAKPFFAALYLYQPGDGGLDRVAILLANHLQKRGIRVELWMARTDGPTAGLIDPAVKVRTVRAPRWSRRLSMIAQFPVLAAMVRRYRPDILYSAGNQSNMLAAVAAIGTACQAVGRISNPIVRPGVRSGFAAWARLTRFRAIARTCAMTIVMGDHDRQLLADAGPLEGRAIRLLPRPTVTADMERARSDRAGRAVTEPRNFLMVGRLAPQKGQGTALAALAGMTHVDWHLRIVGQGPLRERLERQCVELGIADRVEFLGYVDDAPRVATLMAQADLLLQPSCWEGLAATVIEGLACGTGVVATDCTDNIRPIMTQAGQHPPVPVGDVAAFADAIEWTLAHPAPVEQMARAVRGHGVERALDQYLRAFHSIAAPSPEPADLARLPVIH